MDIDKVIKERHSTRRFSTKKPDWKKIIEAIDAANECPRAGNINVMKFILVDNKDKIRKLAEASQQDFFEDVPYIVAVLTDTTQLVRSYDERGLMYARQQAGAAIENFLLKIVDLGLASCWVGAFVDDEVKDILEVTKPYDNIQVEALLPVGYEMPGKVSRRRESNLDQFIWFNKWKNKYMIKPHKPEAG